MINEQILKHLKDYEEKDKLLNAFTYEGRNRDGFDSNIDYINCVLGKKGLLSHETQNNLEGMLISTFISKAREFEDKFGIHSSQEAAGFYLKAGEKIKAAELYFNAGDYEQTEKILKELKKPDLLNQVYNKIAKKYQAERRFLEASVYYELNGNDELFACNLWEALVNKELEKPSDIEHHRNQKVKEYDLKAGLIKAADFFKEDEDGDKSYYLLKSLFYFSKTLTEKEQAIQKIKGLDPHYLGCETSYGMIETMKEEYKKRMQEFLHSRNAIKANAVMSKIDELTKIGYKRTRRW